jgi:hypothetical protein
MGRRRVGRGRGLGRRGRGVVKRPKEKEEIGVCANKLPQIDASEVDSWTRHVRKCGNTRSANFKYLKRFSPPV